MPTKKRFPLRRFYGQAMQTTLQALMSQRDVQDRMLDQAGYTGRRVLGYKLPVWQRPVRWDDEQCLRFIESIWLGVGIGCFMVNACYQDEALDLILLDGQQRLRAIERYWAGELAVAGEDGEPHTWNELSEEERRHFLRIPFPWIETQYQEEAQAREAYNRHNFGGTAHTLEQRA